MHANGVYLSRWKVTSIDWHPITVRASTKLTSYRRDSVIFYEKPLLMSKIDAVITLIKKTGFENLFNQAKW